MKSTDLSTRRWELAKAIFRQYERDLFAVAVPLPSAMRRELWQMAYRAACAALDQKVPLEISK
jgi:hypothetical protein